MKVNNSIVAVKASQELKAQGEAFFVPGFGRVVANSLSDVPSKLPKRQPKKKVEAGDVNR